MSRPKYEPIYGQRSGKNLMFLDYVGKLEIYCDELEKALDKACTRLEFAAKVINEFHGYNDDKYAHKERWKEWCMKDE